MRLDLDCGAKPLSLGPFSTALVAGRAVPACAMRC